MKKKVESIKTKSEKKNYNYGLPVEFSLDYDIISHDVALDTGLMHSEKEIKKNLKKYIKESYVDVDCRLLAKQLIGLPKKPPRYHFSLIIFKVCSDNDFFDLLKAYPDKYMPIYMKGRIAKRADAFIFQQAVVNGPIWRKEIAENVKKYFNPEKYKRPLPILIKYGRCGCYTKNIEADEFIRDNLKSGLQHTPWLDYDYHRVLTNSPIRLRKDLTMNGFLQAVVTKANEYTQAETLSFDEVFEAWFHFMHFNLVLKKDNGINERKLKEVFNSKVAEFRTNASPQNDFYLKNYVNYLFELEEKKIISVCKCCYSAFDYHDRRKYCTDKCKKAACNARDYRKYLNIRREKSRESTRELREYYKSRNLEK